MARELGQCYQAAYMMVALGLHVTLALVFRMPGEEISGDCISSLGSCIILCLHIHIDFLFIFIYVYKSIKR